MNAIWWGTGRGGGHPPLFYPCWETYVFVPPPTLFWHKFLNFLIGIYLHAAWLGRVDKWRDALIFVLPGSKSTNCPPPHFPRQNCAHGCKFTDQPRKSALRRFGELNINYVSLKKDAQNFGRTPKILDLGVLWTPKVFKRIWDPD